MPSLADWSTLYYHLNGKRYRGSKESGSKETRGSRGLVNKRETYKEGGWKRRKMEISQCVPGGKTQDKNGHAACIGRDKQRDTFFGTAIEEPERKYREADIKRYVERMKGMKSKHSRSTHDQIWEDCDIEFIFVRNFSVASEMQEYFKVDEKTANRVLSYLPLLEQWTHEELSMYESLKNESIHHILRSLPRKSHELVHKHIISASSSVLDGIKTEDFTATSLSRQFPHIPLSTTAAMVSCGVSDALSPGERLVLVNAQRNSWTLEDILNEFPCRTRDYVERKYREILGESRVVKGGRKGLMIGGVTNKRVNFCRTKTMNDGNIVNQDNLAENTNDTKAVNGDVCEINEVDEEVRGIHMMDFSNVHRLSSQNDSVLSDMMNEKEANKENSDINGKFNRKIGGKLSKPKALEPAKWKTEDAMLEDNHVEEEEVKKIIGMQEKKRRTKRECVKKEEEKKEREKVTKERDRERKKRERIERDRKKTERERKAIKKRAQQQKEVGTTQVRGRKDRGSGDKSIASNETVHIHIVDSNDNSFDPPDLSSDTDICVHGRQLFSPDISKNPSGVPFSFLSQDDSASIRDGSSPIIYEDNLAVHLVKKHASRYRPMPTSFPSFSDPRNVVRVRFLLYPQYAESFLLARPKSDELDPLDEIARVFLIHCALYFRHSRVFHELVDRLCREMETAVDENDFARFLFVIDSWNMLIVRLSPNEVLHGDVNPEIRHFIADVEKDSPTVEDIRLGEILQEILEEPASPEYEKTSKANNCGSSIGANSKDELSGTGSRLFGYSGNCDHFSEPSRSSESLVSPIFSDNFYKEAILRRLREKTSVSRFAIHAILLRVYSRVVSPESRKLRDYKCFTAETYGELLPAFISAVLTHLDFRPHQKFYDLGSGVGNATLQAALEFGAATSGGCELMVHASTLAEGQHRLLQKHLSAFGLAPINVDFALSQSFVKNERVKKAAVACDVVLVNNYLFDANLNAEVGRMLKDLRPGVKIISLRDFLGPRYKPTGDSVFDRLSVEKFMSDENVVSWTGRSIEYWVSTVMGPSEANKELNEPNRRGK